MAGLKERVAAEQREALKAGDKVRLATLRLLAAAVKNREIEVRHELGDEEVVEMATREAKRRREAIEAYERAGRPDRAEAERAELAVLESYLPPALPDEELEAIVERVVAETGASGPGDLGKVMGRVMAEVRGRVDGRLVQERVRARLGG